MSTHYAALAHLRWAVDPSNATPTADCFGVLLSNLSAVVRATGTALSPNEKEVFRAVCRATERLVARALENYRLLDESVPSGVAEPDSAPSQTPAPALEPAVGLFCLLR